MVFLKPAEQFGNKEISPKCALSQSRSHMNLNMRKVKNEVLFGSVLSARSNLTNDPYQLQLQHSTNDPLLQNKSSLSQIDKFSNGSKSPSPVALQRSSTVLDPHQSRLSEDGRTVFFRHYGPHHKTGTLCSYKFSYDDSAYYFKLTRQGEDASHTLILPVCRQTIELIE